MASIYANGAKGHHKFTLTVSQVSTSKEENTSTVSFQFTISPVVKSYDWRYWGNSISYCVNVNGTAFAGTIPDYDGYATVTLKSDNLTVPHNADGTKELSFSFTVTDKSGMSYTCGNANASGSMGLTRILRNPPTLTVSVEDRNPATVALTGNKGKLVRYFSNAAFSFGAEAHDGASIESRTVSCGGKSLSGEAGVFEKAVSGSFVFTAADSYGNSASETVDLPLIPYIPLTCNLLPSRPDAAGHMAINVSGNCFGGNFGAKENALKVFVRYRESGGDFGDWTEITAHQTGNNYVATGELSGLDYQKAYVFQAKAEDLLDTAETPEYTAKAIPVFDWGENDFNVNGMFKVNGMPVADFIVEQGTDGMWSYRKWSSGAAECWTETDCTVSWAGNFPVYYSKTNLCPEFPGQFFAFAPVVSVSVPNSNGAYVLPCITVVSEEGLTLVFGRLYGGADDVSAKVKIYAIGKWK